MVGANSDAKLMRSGEAVRSWAGHTSFAVKRQNSPLGFPQSNSEPFRVS